MIRFGMGLLEIVEQLTKGYVKATGKNPGNLEKIKIQQEAVQRFKDMNKVVDMEGKTIDTSKGIMGGQQANKSGIMKATGAGPKVVEGINPKFIDYTIDSFKNMDGIKVMKEANKIIKREGPYKDLTKKDAKRIMDAVDDKLKNIDMDPEDMYASGGRIGFQGGGKDASEDNFGGGFNTGQGGGAQFSGSGGDISPGTDLGGGFRGAGGGGGKGDNPIVEGTKNAVKNIAINQLSKKLGFAKFANPIGQLMAIKGLYDSIKNPTGTPNQFGFGDDDEDDSKKEKGPESVSLGTGLAEQAKQAIIDRQAQIEEAAKALGYAQGGRITFDSGGSPLQRLRQEIVDSMKGYAPADVTEDQLQLVVKDITLDMTPEQAQASALSNFRKLFGMAKGGRIGLKAGMSKRAFLKLMGSVGGGIAALKTGLLGFGKGAGKEVAKEVAKETVKTQPPPYFFELAEKIKILGRVSDGPQERIKVYSMKGKDGKSELMLTEDVGTGEIQIKKIGKEGDEMITEVQTMEYTPGSSMADETTKGIPSDQYDEYTEYNSRIIKDEYNDPMIEEGIKVDEIIEEVKDQAPSIKKAGGGIARMLGE